MHGDFDEILGRERTRCWKESDDGFVERGPFAGARDVNGAECGVAGFERLTALEQFAREAMCVRTADANDRDRASARWRGGGCDRVACRKHRQPARRAVQRAEMMTVFTDASPMLSELQPGSSATAMCTMRRS